MTSNTQSHTLQALTDLSCLDFAEFKRNARVLCVEAFVCLGEPFLLALDGIDRRIYTRVIDNPSEGGPLKSEDSRPSIYLAQASNGQTYEIRLSSWNCTCAQFVYSMHVTDRKGDEPRIDNSNSLWGGNRARASMEVPYCKHLIACTLLENSGTVFAQDLRVDYSGQDFTA